MEKYIRKKNLAWQKLGDHTLLLENGDKKMAHHLDEVGNFIWSNIEEHDSKELLLKTMLDIYDVEESIAKSDLDNFLDKLENLNLIVKQSVC